MAKYELERAQDWTDPRGKVTMNFTSLVTGEAMHKTEIDLGPPVFHPKGERGVFRTKADARKAVRSGAWANVHGYRL